MARKTSKQSKHNHSLLALALTLVLFGGVSFAAVHNYYQSSAQAQVLGESDDREETEDEHEEDEQETEHEDGEDQDDSDDDSSRRNDTNRENKVEFQYEMKTEGANEDDNRPVRQKVEFQLEQRNQGAEQKLEFKSTAEERLIMRHASRSAVVNHPLSIDPETNELTVTTPGGVRVVAVLPDQAVANMIRNGIISEVSNSSTSSAALEEESMTDDSVVLEVENDTPVYKVKGVSRQRFLGIVPVGIEKKVTVSAEDGSVVSQETGFWQGWLDRFSF